MKKIFEISTLIFLCNLCFADSVIHDNNITFNDNNPINFLSKYGFLFKTIDNTEPFFVFDGENENYQAHGPGTFNVNPKNDIDGFYIGEKTLKQILEQYSGNVQDKKCALFIFPVNFNTNGTYNGFEIKASTNNFLNIHDEQKSLQYYAQSQIANTGIPNDTDRMYIFTCTSKIEDPNENLDFRSWSYIKNTTVWTEKILTVAVFVDFNCLERHKQDPNKPEDDWLTDSNEELVWSWARMKDSVGNTTYEKDSRGGIIWRPIMPVRWFKKLPEWAESLIQH